MLYIPPDRVSTRVNSAVAAIVDDEKTSRAIIFLLHLQELCLKNGIRALSRDREFFDLELVNSFEKLSQLYSLLLHGVQLF